MTPITKEAALQKLPDSDTLKILKIEGRAVTFGKRVNPECLAKVASVALLLLMCILPILFCFRSVREKRAALSHGVSLISKITFAPDGAIVPQRPARVMDTIRVSSSQPLSYEMKISKMRAGLDVMRDWKRAGDWAQFHVAHYDWFMYPSDVDRTSQGCGRAFSWSFPELEQMKSDHAAINDFREAVELYFEACGWSVTNDCEIDLQPGMKRETYQVRLGKILLACQNLGQEDLYARGRAYVEKFVPHATDGALKAALGRRC